MTNQLAIYQLGNPILRQIAAPVSHISDPAIQQLIEQMLDHTHRCQGMGLAAPQIGQSLQILIIASHPNPRYPHAPQMSPMVFINPTVNSHSQSQHPGWEGCLSIPGWRGRISRYDWIEISYRDRTNQTQTLKLTDFPARIFQHEYDHLIGKVFLDRLASPSDLYTEAEYFAHSSSL